MSISLNVFKVFRTRIEHKIGKNIKYVSFDKGDKYYGDIMKINNDHSFFYKISPKL